MRITVQTFILSCFGLLLFSRQASAQQASSNSEPTTPTVNRNPPLSIGAINNTFLPIDSKNYILSSTINDMQNHTFIISTDSSETIAYIMINGIKEKLTATKNGEHLPIYSNGDYTVVINKTTASLKNSKSVQKAGANESLNYSPLEGSITVSDMRGNVVSKPFIGAELVK